MRVAARVTLGNRERVVLRILAGLPVRGPSFLRLPGRTSPWVDPRRSVPFARAVLLMAEGKQDLQIARKFGVDPRTVARWRRRYLELGTAAVEWDPMGRPTPAGRAASIALQVRGVRVGRSPNGRWDRQEVRAPYCHVCCHCCAVPWHAHPGVPDRRRAAEPDKPRGPIVHPGELGADADYCGSCCDCCYVPWHNRGNPPGHHPRGGRPPREQGNGAP